MEVRLTVVARHTIANHHRTAPVNHHLPRAINRHHRLNTAREIVNHLALVLRQAVLQALGVLALKVQDLASLLATQPILLVRLAHQLATATTVEVAQIVRVVHAEDKPQPTLANK